MRRCSACGGVLGRDCFNEQDCLQITNSMNSQNAYDASILEDVQRQLGEACNYISELASIVYSNTGDLSDKRQETIMAKVEPALAFIKQFEPKEQPKTIHRIVNSDDDDLPF